MWGDAKKKREKFNTAYGQLRQLFREHGIESVRVEYEGSGDSGQWNIEGLSLEGDETSQTTESIDPTGAEVVVASLTPSPVDKMLLSIRDGEIKTWGVAAREEWSENGWRTVHEERTIPLKELVDDLTSYALDCHAPGWEINEGSRGEVLIYADRLEVNHDQYVVETLSSSQTFEPEIDAMEEVAHRMTVGK